MYFPTVNYTYVYKYIYMFVFYGVIPVIKGGYSTRTWHLVLLSLCVSVWLSVKEPKLCAFPDSMLRIWGLCLHFKSLSPGSPFSPRSWTRWQHLCSSAMKKLVLQRALASWTSWSSPACTSWTTLRSPKRTWMPSRSWETAGAPIWDEKTWMVGDGCWPYLFHAVCGHGSV